MTAWNEGAMDHEPVYRLEIREQGRVIETHEHADPFHYTTLHVRGWRNALRVLFHRYDAVVWQTADRDVCERIAELNPDYLGAQGSARRARWDSRLDDGLASFADETGGAAS